eukprot:676178-Amphidinium_carterae.2
MKPSYTRAQLCRETWTKDLESGIWAMIFKKVVAIHYSIIDAAIDEARIIREVREASRKGAMSSLDTA